MRPHISRKYKQMKVSRVQGLEGLAPPWGLISKLKVVGKVALHNSPFLQILFITVFSVLGIESRAPYMLGRHQNHR